MALHELAMDITARVRLQGGHLAALTVADVEEVLGAAVRSLHYYLRQNGRLMIRDFGVFEICERAAKKIRDFRTGQIIEKPACRALRFKIAQSFRKEFEEEIKA